MTNQGEPYHLMVHADCSRDTLQETVSRAPVGGVPKSVRDISFGPMPRVLTLL